MNTPVSDEELAHDIETVILRRLYENRIAGYTLEMSQELAALVQSLRSTQPADRAAVIEECAKRIEEYGEGLIPSLRVVAYWLAPEIRALTPKGTTTA